MLASTALRSAVKGFFGSSAIGSRTRLPPTPSPCQTRFGKASCKVAIAAAVATGCLEKGFVIPGPTVRFSVSMRIAVMVT